MSAPCVRWVMPIFEGCNAFVLHARPYKETSALVDFLGIEGRFRAVLRGARSQRGSVARPFQPLEISVRGKHELKNIVRLEAAGVPCFLHGRALFSGLYLNELLLRLLPLEEPYPALFEHYHLTLLALAEARPLEPLLRAFEWQLLVALGYDFSLNGEGNGAPLQPNAYYAWHPETGLYAAAVTEPSVFLGAELLALANADWQVAGALTAAKRLMRQVFNVHLGGRPLHSRALFLSP